MTNKRSERNELICKLNVCNQVRDTIRHSFWRTSVALFMKIKHQGIKLCLNILLSIYM